MVGNQNGIGTLLDRARQLAQGVLCRRTRRLVARTGNIGGQDVGHGGKKTLLGSIAAMAGGQLHDQHAQHRLPGQQWQTVMAMVLHAGKSNFMARIDMVGEHHLATDGSLAAKTAAQRQLAAAFDHLWRFIVGRFQFQVLAIRRHQMDRASGQRRQPGNRKHQAQTSAQRLLQRTALQHGFQQLPQDSLALTILPHAQVGRLGGGDVLHCAKGGARSATVIELEFALFPDPLHFLPNPYPVFEVIRHPCDRGVPGASQLFIIVHVHAAKKECQVHLCCQWHTENPIGFS